MSGTSALDVIKQYMVSLGFSVDKTSFDSATKTIDSAGESLAKLAGGTVKQFAIAGVAVTSFFTTAIVGMAKFLNGLGNAQIQYEMLARQLWTTKENAEAFDTTLKAMGTNLQQLYLSPTLMQQFQQLHSQAFQMMPPAEFQQQMQFIQSITFEFKRMKLEGTYALQWIGYYFIKYMAGPITSIQMTLHGINDTIIKKMPYWTKVVAEVMSWFGQFGVTAVESIKGIAQEFNNIGDKIPQNIKLIGLAIAALGVIASTGPIGKIILGITAIGLAVNDFLTYIHGGKSEWGSFWQKLIDFYNKLKDPVVINIFRNTMKVAFNAILFAIDEVIIGVKNFYKALEQNGAINNVKKTFQNTFSIIGTLTKNASNWFKSMYKALNQTGVLKSLSNDVLSLFKGISKVEVAFTGLIKKILGLKGTQSAIKNVGDWLITFIVKTLDVIDSFIKSITSGLNALADLFQGKWGDMWKNLGDIFTKDAAPITKGQSYIYPSSTNHHTNNSSKVTVNNTNNIYGSDPKATASAATNNLTTVLRNTKGVIY
ncbi:MAG: hypothetical protein Q8934_14250 [Bacillota bacterium]|nr:hypothetical protein [Bacillota bacterium]